MASIALFRLLGYLAAGGLVSLALIQRGQVSRAFFRFSAALYAGLIGVGLLVRPDALAHLRLVVCEGAAGPALAAGAALALFAAAGVLAATQAALVDRLGSAVGRGLLQGAALAAAAGVLLDGLGAVPAASALPRALGPASALLSAALLGSALTAMTLGHWYLVLPRLSPAPLYRLTFVYAGAVALRAALLVGAVALLYLTPGRAFDRFAAEAGFLVWPRLLLGVIVPGVLALTALPAARARDTQPATGMLYVACVLVLVGEGLGLYLAAHTGVPL